MMQPVIVIFLCYISMGWSSELDCGFHSTYPKQYIAYYTKDQLTLDGKLDEKLWSEVEFTDDFVDISTETKPYLNTKAKIRWNDEYLYIAAILEETHVWANISETCHCLNETQDQVIFHDNDFEIFVDADGSNHYYKEFEMNAWNATWDLVLNKPYNDNGYENSTRVYGSSGFDMQPPLQCGAFIEGGINDPKQIDKFWSVEVALPLTGLAVNNTVEIPPKSGTFWRINFSRVEWHVNVVNDTYVKNPSCQSCPVPGAPNEDNWVWSPQGAIAMHLPERWGMLQFSTDEPGTSPRLLNKEWPVRSVAMTLYYAEHSFQQQTGIFTNDPAVLQQYADPPVLSGECTSVPLIELTGGGTGFVARITSADGSMTAVIRDDRLLLVEYNL